MISFKIFLSSSSFLKKKWQDILLRNCKKMEGVKEKKSLQDSKFATMNPSRDGKMTVNVFKSQYYPLHAISRHDFEIYIPSDQPFMRHHNLYSSKNSHGIVFLLSFDK